jgi:hypothetical protein
MMARKAKTPKLHIALCTINQASAHSSFQLPASFINEEYTFLEHSESFSIQRVENYVLTISNSATTNFD